MALKDERWLQGGEVTLKKKVALRGKEAQKERWLLRRTVGSSGGVVALRKRYDFKGRGGCKEERRTLLRGGDS